MNRTKSRSTLKFMQVCRRLSLRQILLNDKLTREIFFLRYIRSISLNISVANDLLTYIYIYSGASLMGGTGGTYPPHFLKWGDILSFVHPLFEIISYIICLIYSYDNNNI